MTTSTPEMSLSVNDKIAELLFSIGAIQINVKNPFEWTSGILSPIYCDHRKVNSYVNVRNEVVTTIADYILRKYPEVDIIAGVATGGIAIGVLIADRMKLPFIYVRNEAKKYGLMKQVEGHYEKGDTVVLIEDHISTGGSSLKAIEGLQKEELNLLCLISNMTYGFDKTEANFKEKNITHYSLCDLDVILKTAVRLNYISSSDMEEVYRFKEDPANWASGRK